ncbi:threonine/homoserine efflux transporter RhtA [Limnobacter thiooxidans]|nr:threonine/homoserine efflux transporter RhtA [Limnobacter thiooxidans]
MKKVEVSTLIFTILAMCAFAANSFFCRAALGAGQIDPASFTAIRLISGAVTLWLCLRIQNTGGQQGSWIGAMALFGYAALFSMAYVTMSTGTGALILFASVQFSMIAYAATKGDRLRGLRAVGALVASAGLVLLLWPHVQTPASLFAAGSMALAGVCWGVYSVVGKGSKSPMADTAGNFSRAALLMALLWLAVYCAAQAGIHIPGVTVERGLALYTVFLPAPTLAGVLFALASGCLASGIGYAVWYKVLPALHTTSAASVQLSVPVIAALAGVVFLDEALTLTLLLAMFMTLGGVYLVLRVTR